MLQMTYFVPEITLTGCLNQQVPVGKYGGKPYVNEAGDTVDGWVVFDSRRQARQAASEIAGDLGSDPRALRLSGDKADKWWYRDSNRVVGRERLDSSGKT